MTRQLEVALIIDPTKPYDRKIVRGVAAFVQSERLNWSLYVEEDASGCLPDLKNWDGDGILANLDNRRVASALTKLCVPIVAIGGGYGYYKTNSKIPYIRTDNCAIAELAAEHLLNLGLRSFAFCGEPPDRFNGWAKERQVAFSQYLNRLGFECRIFTGKHRASSHWKQSQSELTKWLRSLPIPVGLFACKDARARHALQACRTAQLRVPEDVAVVGVDNDDIMCELSRPPLTSIEQGAMRIGSEAALVLHLLMSGKKPPVSTAVQPEGIVERQSTDLLATDDEDVAGALRYIRECACKPIQVRDVLEIANVSRSTLEARFRELIGRSIHSEIRRVQMERAIKLLKTSRMSMKQISNEIGASSVQYFTTLVREYAGCTPGSVRSGSLRTTNRQQLQAPWRALQPLSG